MGYFSEKLWGVSLESCKIQFFSYPLSTKKSADPQNIHEYDFFFFCLTSAPIALSVRNSSFPKHSICFSTLHLPMQFPLAQILFIFLPLAIQEQDVSIPPFVLSLRTLWLHVCEYKHSNQNHANIDEILWRTYFPQQTQINLIPWYQFSI